MLIDIVILTFNEFSDRLTDIFFSNQKSTQALTQALFSCTFLNSNLNFIFELT